MTIASLIWYFPFDTLMLDLKITLALGVYKPQGPGSLHVN